MTWGQAQAGNRASKTRPYLQWWVNKSEQDVRSSALQNLHHSARFFVVLHTTGVPPTNPAVKGSCMVYTQLVSESVLLCGCFNHALLRVTFQKSARLLSMALSVSCCTCRVRPRPMPTTLLKHSPPLGRCLRIASELSISPTAIPCRMHRISSDLRS